MLMPNMPELILILKTINPPHHYKTIRMKIIDGQKIFEFGEIVLIDNDKTGQIIHYCGQGKWTVDEGGMWNNYHESILTSQSPTP